MHWYVINSSSERGTEYLNADHVVSFWLIPMEDGKTVALLVTSRGGWHIVGPFTDDGQAFSALNRFTEGKAFLHEVPVAAQTPAALDLLKRMGLPMWSNNCP